MSSNFWIYVIIGVVVSFLMKYITRPTGKEFAPDANGLVHLRMNKAYQIVGFIGVIFGVAFLVFLPTSMDDFTAKMWLITFFLFLLFVGTGAYCLLFYRNHKINFSDAKLSVANVFGKTRSVGWGEITNVHFNMLTGMIVVSAPSHEVKIHQHVVGLEMLVKKLESATGHSAKQLKLTGLIRKN